MDLYISYNNFLKP